MAKRPSTSVYLDAFLDRVRRAREGAGFKQREIADLLGIEQDLYAKYEVRSFMPHHLVPLFCTACHIDTEWLFAERGKGPVGQVSEPKKARVKRKARKAA